MDCVTGAGTGVGSIKAEHSTAAAASIVNRSMPKRGLQILSEIAHLPCKLSKILPTRRGAKA